MSNIMKEVASALGVRLGERFRIEGYDQDWCLTEDGLRHNGNQYSIIGNDMLVKLLTGKVELVKRPWRPQYNKPYVFWQGEADGEMEATWTIWMSLTSDIARLAMGNCFRTGEEAIANKDKVLAAYKAILDSLQDNK